MIVFGIILLDAVICEVLCLFMELSVAGSAPMIAIFAVDTCMVGVTTFMFHRSDERKYLVIENTDDRSSMDLDFSGDEEADAKVLQ
jgi:hypothetical protein